MLREYNKYPKGLRGLLTQLQIKVTLSASFQGLHKVHRDLEPQKWQSRGMKITCYFHTSP